MALVLPELFKNETLSAAREGADMKRGVNTKGWPESNPLGQELQSETHLTDQLISISRPSASLDVKQEAVRSPVCDVI